MTIAALPGLSSPPSLVSAAAVAAVATARAQFGVTANGTVGNTLTETTLINSTGLTGSLVLGANTLTAGKTLLVLGWGFIGSTLTPTLQIRAKLNGTALLDTTAFTAVAITGTNMWQLTLLLNCRTAGAGGTGFGQGIFSYFSAANTQQNQQLVRSTSYSLDTTVTQTVDITAQWAPPIR